ncbi:hypothetical protein ES708_15879 [subsurface metagenome]
MKEIKFENILKVNDEIKERVRQWRNKEEIRKYMLSQHIITKEEHLNWIESVKNRNDWKFWVVFVDEIPIGTVYLQNIDYKNLTSEWGFYIGEDDFKGKGLGKHILFKLLEFYFEEMKFEVLFTKVISNNIAALNIYRKFKFKMINDFLDNQRKVVLLKFTKKDWSKWSEVLKNEYFYNDKE